MCNRVTWEQLSERPDSSKQQENQGVQYEAFMTLGGNQFHTFQTLIGTFVSKISGSSGFI